MSHFAHKPDLITVSLLWDMAWNLAKITGSSKTGDYHTLLLSNILFIFSYT
jgi:hypothetical protein